MWLEVVGDQPLPELPPQVILSAIAEREGVESDDQFKALLEGNPALRAEVEALLALTQIATLDPEAMAAIQAVEPMLMEWFRTPDWEASRLFLAENQDTLLTDVGEKALDLLVRANPHNELLTVHLTLLRRCRQLGVDAAFEEFQAARQDPVGRAIAALLAAISPEALAQTLTDHPALGELPAIERVAGLVQQAQAGGSRDDAVQWLYFATVMAERYLYSHTKGIVAADQEEFIAVLEGLIVTGEELAVADEAEAAADLVQALRSIAGHACNALGNHRSDAEKDYAAAIAAYTRGSAFDPANAMQLRNRAGAHIELGDCDAAAADIEAATAMEPDALRLVELNDELAKCREGSDLGEQTEDAPC